MRMDPVSQIPRSGDGGHGPNRTGSPAVLLVGLTGGIAAGKSTVAARLHDLGARVVDADALARQVVEPGTAGLAAVVDAFGPAVVRADGFLDRPALGRVVFADPVARERLNGIVHPLVRGRFAAAVAATPVGSVLVHDVPLLVELGMGPQYNLVVVVHADAAERVRRLVAERGMTEDDAGARLASQADDAAREAAADVWLDNTRAAPDVLAEVDRLWADRLVPYAANLAAHRRAARLGTVTLAPYDPAWAVQAARQGARIRWLCRGHPRAGELAVEHIGSTAVAGLRAKPVIDLQLAVPSLSVADEVEPTLTAGGFVRSIGNDVDSPKPVDPDPAHWRKRFYGGCDPGLVVHLHVRATGSAGWRYAVLFRDWLRGDAGARAAYEARKLRLAAEHPVAADYAVAKESWFDDALARAEDWAGRTGWRPPA